MNKTFAPLARRSLAPRADACVFLSLLAALMIGTIITACSSLEAGPETVRIHGMVSNEDGLPVRDAEVSLTGVDPVQTDIRGRFVVGNVPVGRGLASVRHPYYRGVETEIFITGPADVIHVRLQSVHAARDGIVESAVAAIARADFEDARAILASLEDDEGDPRLSLLSAVVFWRLGHIAEALLEIARLDRIPGTAAVASALRGAIEEETE